jgi:hypothetical protein
MSELTDATAAINAAKITLDAAAQASTDANTATVELASELDGRILAAIADADANVIIPVMSMYTNQVAMAVSLANINTSFITLITPEA